MSGDDMGVSKSSVITLVAFSFAAVVLMGMLVWRQGRMAERTAAESAAKEAVAEAERLESMADDDYAEVVREGRANVEAALGVDLSSRDGDQEAMERVLSALLTWADHDGYEAAREEAVKAGAPKDCQLLTELVPHVEQVTHEDGSTYDPIGASGANMTFVSLDASLLAEPWEAHGKRVVRSYAGEAVVSVTGEEGHSAQGGLFVLCSFAEDGSIVAFEGHVVT